MSLEDSQEYLTLSNRGATLSTQESSISRTILEYVDRGGGGVTAARGPLLNLLIPSLVYEYSLGEIVPETLDFLKIGCKFTEKLLKTFNGVQSLLAVGM